MNHRKAFREGFYEKAAELGYDEQAVHNLFIKDIMIKPDMEKQAAWDTPLKYLFAAGSGIKDIITRLAPTVVVGVPVLGAGIGATAALIKHRLARDTLEKERISKLLSQKIKDERDIQRTRERTGE